MCVCIGEDRAQFPPSIHSNNSVEWRLFACAFDVKRYGASATGYHYKLTNLNWLHSLYATCRRRCFHVTKEKSIFNSSSPSNIQQQKRKDELGMRLSCGIRIFIEGIYTRASCMTKNDQTAREGKEKRIFLEEKDTDIGQLCIWHTWTVYLRNSCLSCLLRVVARRIPTIRKGT